MSKDFEKIKEYYDNGLWSIDRVKNMVVKSVITPDEYKEITNVEYEG